MGSFLALIRRDLALAWRIGGGASFSLIFFLMIVTLTPFAIGPDLNLLSRIALPSCGSAQCWRP